PTLETAAEYVKVRGFLSEEQTRQLEALAKRTRVTLNTVVLGAWGILLARYSGDEQIVFGTTTSGRPAALDGVDEMIGMFVNTLPLRLSVRDDARLGAWLREIQRTQLDAREYEYASHMQIQAWSDIAPGTPLYESHVTFQNLPSQDATSPDATSQ